MTRRNITILCATALLAAALAGGGGCADARSSARPAALLTLDQLEEYEKALDQVAAKQEQFYQNTTRLLSEDASRGAFIEQNEARIYAIDEFADTLLLESRGVPVSKLQKFLVDSDERFDAALAAQKQAEAEAEAQKSAAFAQIASNRDLAASIKGEILDATRTLSVADRVQFLVDFGKGVQKDLKASQDKSPTTKASPTTRPTTAPMARPSRRVGGAGVTGGG